MRDLAALRAMLFGELLETGFWEAERKLAETDFRSEAKKAMDTAGLPSSHGAYDSKPRM
jgi:hypothetical protein